MTPDRKAPGIYVPDNPALDDVLRQSGGRGFRLDHARLLLHFVCVKRWMHDVDQSGFARLNATILRHWIQPRAFGPLKRCLVDRDVLVTDTHAAGRQATGFRIAAPFDGLPRRHAVKYAPLAEKLLAWRATCETTRSDPETEAVINRRGELLEHLRASLDALSLPAAPEAMVDTLRGQADSGHIAYVAQCIAHRDHDGLSVDAFGWRAHHLISRTSSHLRPLLLLDRRSVAEVDIANSQPLLLAILLGCSSPDNAQHKRRMHNIVEGAGKGASLFLSVSGADREKKKFLAACETGELYDLLARDVGVGRDQAKRLVFRDVLFGKAHISGRLTEAFDRRWPALLEAIRAAKRRYGHKVIAQALQRLESFIVLDCICLRLLQELPDLPFLTIHDSTLLVADAAETVRDVMEEEFARWGVKSTLHIKDSARQGPPGSPIRASGTTAPVTRGRRAVWRPWCGPAGH